MNSELVYSRPQKTAEQLGNFAEDRHRFLNKHILLTGEPELLTTPNGRQCLLDSLRLVIRICPNISIHLPTENAELSREARNLAEQIVFGEKVEFLEEPADYGRFDSILSVGTKAPADLPWTAINCNGFLIRATSGPKNISGECGLYNPIAALAAACIGVGEVFKRLIKVKAERGEMLNGFSFSLWTYALSASDYGPTIPDELADDLLVMGAGAIGNGIIHLVSKLPITGQVTIVDRDIYNPENLGTCILISPKEMGSAKAQFLKLVLEGAGISAEGFHGSFEQYSAGLRRFPRIVLNGLDNIDVRHEVQRILWPDIVIDGAIGDFMCQVSSHPWNGDTACLICLFQKPAGRPAEDIQSEATGLSKERLRDLHSILTEADVESAPEEERPALRERLGQKLCSVVQNAVAQKISRDKHSKEFAPSVPFVACFSSCLVVTEALAYLRDWERKPKSRFQFDFLVGPHFGLELPEQRRIDCVCNRRKNIERVRASHNLQRMLT